MLVLKRWVAKETSYYSLSIWYTVGYDGTRAGLMGVLAQQIDVKSIAPLSHGKDIC